MSEQQLADVCRARELQKEADRLKQAEVFLDIPFFICGKPLPNNWERDQLVEIFDSQKFAHALCWKTPRGQLLETKAAIEMLVKYVQDFRR